MPKKILPKLISTSTPFQRRNVVKQTETVSFKSDGDPNATKLASFLNEVFFQDGPLNSALHEFLGEACNSIIDTPCVYSTAVNPDGVQNDRVTLERYIYGMGPYRLELKAYHARQDERKQGFDGEISLAVVNFATELDNMARARINYKASRDTLSSSEQQVINNGTFEFCLKSPNGVIKTGKFKLELEKNDPCAVGSCRFGFNKNIEITTGTPVNSTSNQPVISLNIDAT